MKSTRIICIADPLGFDSAATIAKVVHFFGYINIHSVRDMVYLLERRCTFELMHQLDIIGHGSCNGQYIGMDWVTEASLSTYADELAKLKHLFTHDARVRLLGCQTGHAVGLLAKLSTLWGGIRVQASTASQFSEKPGAVGGTTYCMGPQCRYTGPGLGDILDEALGHGCPQ